MSDTGIMLFSLTRVGDTVWMVRQGGVIELGPFDQVAEAMAEFLTSQNYGGGLSLDMLVDMVNRSVEAGNE